MSKSVYLVFLLSLTSFLILSCSDLKGNVGRNEIVSPQNGRLADRTILAQKDSSYYHKYNNMGGGKLFFGSNRGVEASTLFRFNTFGKLDTIYYDSLNVDSIRLEEVSLTMFGVHDTSGGLFATNATPPITLNLFAPRVNWSQYSASAETLAINPRQLDGTINMSMDTTGADSMVFHLPEAMYSEVQTWITITTRQLLNDTNFGIWLRPDLATAFSIRSFYSIEGDNATRPYLKIKYSRLKDGLPVGFPDSVITYPYDDLSLLSKGTTNYDGLQVGAGDAVRGIIWFDLGDLVTRQVNVHHARMIIRRPQPRLPTDFGVMQAIGVSIASGDSTQWHSEPVLGSTSPVTFAATDSTVVVEVSNVVARWVALRHQTGVLLITDANEGSRFSRSSFGSAPREGITPTPGTPQARLEIIYSELEPEAGK